jgi:signal peptidase I
MSPEYREGDFVLISKIPFIFSPPKPGDIVAFHHAKYGTMIKRISAISPDGLELFVVGSHPYSVDSNRFGPINRKDLLGKVIWHVIKPGHSN